MSNCQRRHVRDADPADLPREDVYVFSSPGRMGKPKGNARRFLRKVRLESGSKYAILITQAAPRPGKKTGQMPTQEQQDRWQRIIPGSDRVRQVLVLPALRRSGDARATPAHSWPPL